MIDTNFTEFDWSGWSEWKSLAGLDMNTVTTGPGAYVIAANQPLHRAVGSDDVRGIGVEDPRQVSRSMVVAVSASNL